MLVFNRTRTWIAFFTTLVFILSMALITPVATSEDNAKPTPQLISGEITNKGDFSLTFDAEIADPTGTEGQFTVTINDAAVKVTAVEATNTVGKIKLVLETKAVAGEVVTVVYAKGEVLQIKSTDGVAVENFTYSNAEDPEPAAPPVLTADTTDNQVGAVIDITFTSTPDWSEKITNVKVDDVSIRDKYAVTDGQIAILAEVFPVARDYAIVVKATGYQDATLTQTIAAPQVEEPEPEVPVADLNDIKGHWAQGNIEQLVALGAIGGYPDGSFAPEKSIKRAEFASVLVKAFKLESGEGKVFADTQDHWAKDAIAAAYANSIISGYNNDKFGPDDTITREQMAVMIVRAAKLAPVTGNAAFTDSDSISAWAAEAVATAYSNQLMSGYPDKTFGPAKGASRAEAVTVIFNSLQKDS